MFVDFFRALSCSKKLLLPQPPYTHAAMGGGGVPETAAVRAIVVLSPSNIAVRKHDLVIPSQTRNILALQPTVVLRLVDILRLGSTLSDY